ncbi:MAG TPA: hypothetical protein VE127_17675 [Solirubrobacteraceae bacterium]|nr:hypothetical protein [Solirubrobacteraceae bacterium]
MSEHDNFEERLRAMADELSRSLQRMSEVDLSEVAERFGVDADRARTFADAAGQWLSGQISAAEPLFSQPAGRQTARPEPQRERGGPHPLDLPTEDQGLALAALDSGRWAVQPGSNQLRGSGDGPPPSPAAPDLASELRARDWISADGTLTLVGRHALARWCRVSEGPAGPPPGPDAPTT